MLQVWSDALAEAAHDHAAGCKFAHNPDRSSYEGQGLYTASPPSADYTVITDAFESWFSERGDYKFDSNSCRASTCGHYTKVN